MNSVLRRSLRPTNRMTVLHRQLLTSRIPHPISQSRRQYSTHNPDAFKDKSAVGVRPLGHLPIPPHAPFPPPSPSKPPPRSIYLKCRFSPLKRLPFSFWLAPASTFTSGGKSSGC